MPRRGARLCVGDAERRGQALRLVAEAADDGEAGSRAPLVLRPEGDGVGGVARVRIAEGLEENVGRAAGEIVERGEDEDAGEAVGEAGIERDVLEGSAEAELVRAAHQRGGFDHLEVVLRARGIEHGGLAEADHAGNFEQRAARVRGQLDRAARELKAEIVDEGRRR